MDGERRSYDPNFVETKPPHVYAIADKAYRNMTTPATEYSQRSQSIMVSGESGAGKTETCKIIMKVSISRVLVGHRRRWIDTLLRTKHDRSFTTVVHAGTEDTLV